jgi:hypothetical protein
MDGTRVVGFFCEDIRIEKTEQDTIIGVLPDTMAAPVFPSITPRLGIYLRVHIDPQKPPKKIVAKFSTPWGETFDVGLADGDLINSAVSQAAEKGLPLAGIVLKAMMAPFVMQTAGLAVATVSIDDGRDDVCAMLNMIEATEPATSSNEPQPHS